LLSDLLNKAPEKEEGKMNASKSVIINVKDVVVCMNRNESIEVVNKSVSSLFGYTPEQLLGQPLSCILASESNSKLYE
jgi:PAS domain S-box-containing protein